MGKLLIKNKYFVTNDLIFVHERRINAEEFAR